MKTKAEELIEVMNEVRDDTDYCFIEISGLKEDEYLPMDEIKETDNICCRRVDEATGKHIYKIIKVPSAKYTIESIKEIANRMKLELEIKGL